MNKIVQYTSKLWYSIVVRRVMHMKGKYSALDIASHVIRNFNEQDEEITQLKLQKLLYFIEAYYMAEYDKDSLYLEYFYAWTYGPVIAEVYSKYKIFMNNPIIEEEENLVTLEKEIKDSIDIICSLFGKLKAYDLITLTHRKGSPWYLTKNQGKISKSKTKEWFKEQFLAGV